MTEPFLKIQNLNKNYNEKEILRNVNLAIYPKEFVALVGQSGGGKSTLLRMIAGLEDFTSGSLHFNSEQPVVRVMFQDDRLLPWMTILDNLCFGSRRRKKRAQARAMLALVGLEDFENYYPEQLSGGQRQRVALGRALMAHPQLLLLDEPLGALDALTRYKMQELISKICIQQDLTAILVTHDVNEAAKMADRVLVIRDGNTSLEEQGGRRLDESQIEPIAKKLFNDIIDENVKGSYAK
jgi:sulfonate transport system ATP-binding protein